MYRAGNQAVHIVLRHHHRAQHHCVFQLFTGLFFGHAFGFAQFAHRRNVLLGNGFRVDDFQAVGQCDVQRFGHGVHGGRVGQQYAARNAFFMADGSGTHSARFGTFGQHDAFVGFTRFVHHVEAELGGRHAVGFAGGGIQARYLRGRTQIGQLCQFGHFRIVANHAGESHCFTGKCLFGQFHAFGNFGGIVAGRGKDDLRVEGSGQIGVFAGQQQMVGIGCDALDDQVLRVQGGGFAD